MSTDAPSAAEPKWMIWTGWVLTALPSLMLLVSAGVKFFMAIAKPADLLKGLTDQGFHENHILGLGILELVCTLIYLFPRTAVLGAILLTGYMGGAIATHVRLFEDYYVQVLVGVMLWGGLYLREPRLRALIPLRG